MSLNTFIREMQRLESMLPKRELVAAVKALDTPAVRQLRAAHQMVESATKAIDFPTVRAMNQIAQNSVGALDTPSAQYVRAMERIVLPSLPSADTMKLVAEAVESYRRYERMIPTFVDEAVRNARKFNQLLGLVKTGIESAARQGQQIQSMVNQASEFVSSVDWQAVRERLEELQSEDEFEAEIETTTTAYCDEFIAGSSGDGTVAVLNQMLRFQIDDSRRRDASDKSMQRRELIWKVVNLFISTAALGVAVHSNLTNESGDKSPSNLGQQTQRKAHRGKPDRGEPNRGKPNRAKPNRAKPDDGKPADKQQKPKP